MIAPHLPRFLAVLDHPSREDSRLLVVKAECRNMHNRIPLGDLDKLTFLLLLEWVEETLWQLGIRTLRFNLTQGRWAIVRHELAWPLTAQVVDSTMCATIDDFVLGVDCNSPATAGALRVHVHEALLKMTQKRRLWQRYQ